ncbi:aldehyde ferredoxin oxidoreductase C-terminal domain-containing protein, partial [Thermodesulfobacteriota bacterium]
VHGKADRPVYLWVGEDSVEIRDAAFLAGKGAINCRETLKERLGTAVRVVAIGPAGENQIPFATILADSDSSCSGGLGAVMGSKNLKAVAVRGKQKVNVADLDGVRSLKGSERPLVTEITSEVAPLNPIAPNKDKLKKEVCYGCTGCMRTRYQGESGRRGKFTCQSAFFYEVRAHRYYGTYNDIPFEATKLCDDYGLDSYFIDCLIMWLVRCTKAGVLTDDQTGIPLSKIGSLEFIETLIRKIAHRDGFGQVLARGIYEAAEAVGIEGQKLIGDYVNKNAHIPLYGPRMYITTGLFYAMEPRLPIQQLHEISTLGILWAYRENGPRGKPFTPEVMRAIAKRFWGSEAAGDFSTYEGKAQAAARIQDRQYAKESLILCDFAWPLTLSERSENYVGDPTLESRLCAAVTGQDIDEAGLYQIGERVLNLQRAILAREGHAGRDYDVLEDFEYNTPLKGDVGNPDCSVPGKDGETFSRKGMVVDRAQFERIKDEYYEIRGWDVGTGLQKRETMEQLGLGEVAETLAREDLLVS